MKRLYSSLLGVCVVLLLTLTASGADTVAVTLDGAPLDIMAYISEDGRTMVPLRDLAQALGFSVAWDPQTRTAAITSGWWSSIPATGAPPTGLCMTACWKRS